LSLIDVIKKQAVALSEAIYFVYLDEYENLAEYQKKVINTWLKHSEIPLIFNLAMKRNAFDVRKTRQSLFQTCKILEFMTEEYIQNDFSILQKYCYYIFLKLALVIYLLL
jgi:hypothetical protein